MALELTEREKAIAQGLNPDEATPNTVVRGEVDGGTEAAAPEDQGSAKEGAQPEAGVPVGQLGTEGQTSGGTDASGQAGTSPSGSWLQDEHKQLASHLGLTEEDLKDFRSADEFSRFTRLIGQQFSRAATSPAAQQQVQQPTQQPAGQQAGQPPAQPGQPARKKPEKLDLAKLKESGFDEDTIRVLSGQNDLVDLLEEQEQRLSKAEQAAQQFQRAMAEQEYTRFISAFHDSVDSLGDERFGKSVDASGRIVNLTKEQDERRRKLYDEIDRQSRGFAAQAQARGQQVQIPPMGTLVQLARQVAFAKELADEARQKLHADIAQQSKQRRPVGGTQVRNTDGTFAKKAEDLSISDQAKALANNPNVVSHWNKLQEANGA